MEAWKTALLTLGRHYGRRNRRSRVLLPGNRYSRTYGRRHSSYATTRNCCQHRCTAPAALTALQVHGKSSNDLGGRRYVSNASASDDENVITVQAWNAKARDFLESQNDDDDDAQSMGELLSELLQITSFMFQKSKTVATTVNEAYDDDNGYDWSFLGIPGSSSAAAEASTSISSPPSVILNDNDPPIDLDSVFALLDLLVELEQSHDLEAVTEITEWPGLSTCLNPILQLWKHQYTDRRLQHKKSRSSTIPRPSMVLEKLDNFRQNSTILLPDVRSYNILLDAVATAPNRSRKTNKRRANHRHHQNNSVDVAFCESLWKWMWKESQHDALIRPDAVTIRTLFKAHVATGHQRAPQRCEALMEEWLRYNNADQSVNNNNNNDITSSDHFKEEQQTSTMLQSLIHVWATFDPKLAESYLKELVEGVLAGKAYEPPTTIDWNRVISAYSIAHGLPAEGHRVLEDFWNFHDQVNNHLGTKTGASSGALEDSSASHFVNAWKVRAPNLRSYNSVLEGYALQQNAVEANKIFSRLQMVASTSPSIATYTSVIKANTKDLKMVDTLAKQCIGEWKQQEQSTSLENSEVSSQDAEQNLLIIDHGIFHVWLNACAIAKDLSTAKTVLKELRSCGILPSVATYLAFLDVFLARNDPQGAIEWLLAYSKLERMNEDEIVAWTTNLLQWYQQENISGVDAMVLLQILCENGFVTSNESIEKLLSHASAEQAVAILGWLPGESHPTLKMRAITMRTLSQDSSKIDVIEKMFREWCSDELRSADRTDHDKDLVADMCASLIVAFSARANMNKMRHWLNIIDSIPSLPPLNLAAQMAVVQAYCQIRDPDMAEKFVVDMESLHKRDASASPPDTAMKNVVLKAWTKEGNGERAASFYKNHIEEPDTVSWNTVINAFCHEGNLDEAESWARSFVDSFQKDQLRTPRPDTATFSMILAAWRRSFDDEAAPRAEKILMWMNGLYERGVILYRPNAKSYNVVLDTWEKSPLPEAAARAQKLLSSSIFRNDKKLVDKVRRIQAKARRRKSITKKESAAA